MKRFITILGLYFLSAYVLPGQSSNPFEIRQIQRNKDSDISRVIRPIFADSISNRTITSTQPEVLPPRVEINPFDIRSFSPQVSSGQILEREDDDLRKSKHWWLLSKLGFYSYVILTLIGLTIGISMNRIRVKLFFKSIINTNALKSLFRRGKKWTEIQFIILYILGLINLALFIIVSLNKEFIVYQGNGSNFILITLLICFVIYLIRHVTMKMISFIFPLGNSVAIYNYSIGVHNIVLGISIMPMILGVQIGPAFMAHFFFIGGIVLFVILFLFRQAKGVLLVFGIRDFNPFYFFLYLCAIEIAPFLIGLRLYNVGAF